MFGPYEVEYEGRRYFGNVSLKEFHTFEYHGDICLVDVAGMAVHSISPALCRAIEGMALNSGALIAEPVMTELRRLELVAGEEKPREAKQPEGPAQSSGKPELPVASIALFIAQECNMRCIYCYGDGGQYGGKGMMSEETAFRAVDWLIANSKSLEKIHISFFGGEPLLNFALMKRIVSYAKEKAAGKNKKVSFGITTNGSLLTDEILSFFRDEKIDPLVSFDGPPEYQNRQRPFKDGGGSYDTVFANIRKLRAAFPGFAVRATLYGEADPLRIRHEMDRAGIETCLIATASPVILEGWPGWGTIEDGWEERALERMLAYNCREIDKLLTAVRDRKIDKDSPSALLGALASLISGQKQHYGCGMGKGMAGISVNGDVFPCHRFAGIEAVRMGNIADYAVDGLNEYHRAIVDALPVCQACWARYYCGGGCFYHNMAHTGDMRRPRPLDCRLRKAAFEGLIYVYCRLDNAEKEYLKDILKNAVPEERRP